MFIGMLNCWTPLPVHDIHVSNTQSQRGWKNWSRGKDFYDDLQMAMGFAARATTAGQIP